MKGLVYKRRKWQQCLYVNFEKLLLDTLLQPPLLRAGPPKWKLSKAREKPCGTFHWHKEQVKLQPEVLFLWPCIRNMLWELASKNKPLRNVPSEQTKKKQILAKAFMHTKRFFSCLTMSVLPSPGKCRLLAVIPRHLVFSEWKQNSAHKPHKIHPPNVSWSDCLCGYKCIGFRNFCA